MKNAYNLELERGLLAGILYNPSMFVDIDGELEPSDFGYEPNAATFRTMRELFYADLAIEEYLVRSKCGKKDKDLKTFEDNLYEIASITPIVGIKESVKELKDLSLKRKLYSLANVIKEQSIEGNIDSLDIINTIEMEVFKLQNNKGGGEFRVFSEATSSMLERILEAKKRGNNVVVGLNTGFGELNYLTNGFKEGELIVLAARPGMGKTAFALNVIKPTLKMGKAVAFFSLEMDAEQILMRLFSSETSIPMQKLINGDLSDDEWEVLNQICDRSRDEWKLFVDDGGNLNIHNLKSKIRRLKLKEPDLAFVVIDYLQIMSGVGNKDRHLEIAEISRGLKNLAREIRIPILALSQLNRMLESREDKRPILSDLRESGAIEQDADLILFLYRPLEYEMREQKKEIEKAKREGKEFKGIVLERKEREDVELIIGKHRNGELKTINITMEPKYTRFLNKETQAESQPTKLDSDMPF